MGRCVRGVRDWIRCCRESKAKVIEKEKYRTLNGLQSLGTRQD